MKFKKLFATILLASMVLTLGACGNTGNGDSEANKNSESSQLPNTDKESEKESEKVEDRYIIKVVDETGAPIAGVMVQLCDDANCMPDMTNDAGEAKFRYKDGVEYTGKIATMPEGYDYATEQHEFKFDGVTSVTITLKKVAS